MGEQKVPRDLHAEVESIFASFLPHLDALISELEKRVIEEERKPVQDTQEPVSFLFLRRVVDQGLSTFSSKNPEERTFLALYRDLSRLKHIRNEMLVLLKS